MMVFDHIVNHVHPVSPNKPVRELGMAVSSSQESLTMWQIAVIHHLCSYCTLWCHFRHALQKSKQQDAKKMLSKTGHPMLGSSAKPSAVATPPSPLLAREHPSRLRGTTSPPTLSTAYGDTWGPGDSTSTTAATQSVRPRALFFSERLGGQLLLRYMGMLCRSVCMVNILRLYNSANIECTWNIFEYMIYTITNVYHRYVILLYTCMTMHAWCTKDIHSMWDGLLQPLICR